MVAAVLLFRFITYFLPIPLGSVAYLLWRRDKPWLSTRTATEGPPSSLAESYDRSRPDRSTVEASLESRAPAWES